MTVLFWQIKHKENFNGSWWENLTNKTRTSPAGHGGPEGHWPNWNCIIRNSDNHGLRFPELGFELLRSFCGTLNRPGYSLGSFLNDLKPPEHPDPRFPDSRFWPFLISEIGNGPGWYIYRRGPRIKSSGSSFIMYSHLPKIFFWSESECTQPI